MKSKSISVVIPVYNENESLIDLVSALDCAFLKFTGSIEYIFIDDGSTDETFHTLREIKKRNKHNCTLIRFRKNLGKSAALSCGFRYTKGDIVITLDADLQDDPAEIYKLLEKLEEGYDLVVGWREMRNDRKGKIRLSKIFNTVVSEVMNISLHDMNCGLKVMNRKVIEEIELYGELHRYIPVLASSKGFLVTEVPVLHHERKFGHSKYGANRIIHASFDLVTTIFLTSYKTRPLHIFGLLGLIISLSGLIPLSYLTYLHFIGITIGGRPLLLMGVLLLLFGVQLFSTGILAELFVSSHTVKDQFPVKELEK